MCGINGVRVLEGGFRVTAAYLKRMRDRMAHRGPDGAGVWVSRDRKVGFGHRRLAIIDTSDAAAQPMSNEDDSLWVTFNGEIYNHQEIRAELERTGRHEWKTDHSDTEVILHAFEEWGIDCLQRFRGMFAFGLYDARNGDLWLVRDRLGIKPLYYSQHHGRVTFASEIKALLADPEQERQVDEEAFYHYLTFLTTPAPMTLFRGIRKLSPGSWIRFRADGTSQEKRYWDVWDHTKPARKSDEDWAKDVLAELRTAVRLHKESDVPVGVFLSGGIDSSTNAALFSETGGEAVKAFTITYDKSYPSYQSELPFAQLMAKQIGAEHHWQALSQKDLLDFLPKMVALQDEPIADPVCVPVYYVSKLAREHGVTVCQVGEGADELFAGYAFWNTILKLERRNRYPVPRFVKRAYMRRLEKQGAKNGMPYEYLRRSVAGEPIFWGGVDIFPDAHKKRILSPRLRSQFADRTSFEAIRPLYERFQSGAHDRSYINWMGYVDLCIRLPELLLMRVDKMAMGVSLEGRVPFLDHVFVELALSIPAKQRMRGGQLKYLLKRAVRGVIPDVLIDRPKQGFGVPVYDWIKDDLGRLARKELEEFCAKTDFLDVHEVRKLLDQGAGIQVWMLLNFALWWKEYIEAGPR